MPAFLKGGAPFTPFGKNAYLRSTKDVKTTSYTVAAGSVPVEVIDTYDQKVLQSGEVMASITSGADAGKIGPFMAGVTDGRQTLANIVGVNDTFLPWQLLQRDVEVAVVYDAACVQGWCFERDSSGARIPLSNTTAAALVAAKSLNVLFK